MHKYIAPIIMLLMVLSLIIMHYLESLHASLPWWTLTGGIIGFIAAYIDHKLNKELRDASSSH